MRKLVITALPAVLALSVWTPTATASSDERVGPVRISRVSYDGAGSDTGSNPSLNREWVAIKNNGSNARQLRGWTLRDPAGHVYRFPRFTLRPGRTVKVHTGSGRRTARHLYWGQDWYVWNNDGDRAILRHRSGRLIDRCAWDDGDGTKRC